MNFSPLNDPEFEKYREEERIKAAKKRRKKALISLSCITLVIAAGFALLAMAAYASFPGLLEKFRKTGEPTPESFSPTESVETFLPPVESDPQSMTDEPQTDTPSETQSETPTREMHVTTVYVDAGHGFLNGAGDAIDIGAGENSFYLNLSESKTGSKMYEADLNLQISLKVRDLLVENGYRVIMSREDYMYERLPINERSKRAGETDADLLVSIHANASESPDAYGPRVLYNDNPSYEFTLESKRFAETLGREINDMRSWTKDTQIVRDSSLAMLKVPFPSILVETCFITNLSDAKLALNEVWQDKMASAIVAAIVNLYPVKTTFI